MNKVFLLGNLGNDPELRYTPSQVAVASFSVATTERSKDKDITTWHKVVVWDKLAENCKKYLYKGSKILVEGKLQTDSYDKEGVKHYSTKIVATKVEFLSIRKENTYNQDTFDTLTDDQSSHIADIVAKPKQDLTSLDDIPF